MKNYFPSAYFSTGSSQKIFPNAIFSNCNLAQFRSKSELSYQLCIFLSPSNGDRSFSAAGPREWNNLPFDIRQSPTISFLISFV